MKKIFLSFVSIIMLTSFVELAIVQEVKCDNNDFTVIITNVGTQDSIAKYEQHLQNNQSHKLSVKLIYQ